MPYLFIIPVSLSGVGILYMSQNLFLNTAIPNAEAFLLWSHLNNYLPVTRHPVEAFAHPSSSHVPFVLYQHD